MTDNMTPESQRLQRSVKVLITVLVAALLCGGSSSDSSRGLRVMLGADVTLSCVFGGGPVEWRELTVEWNLVDKHAAKSIVFTFEDGRAHVNRGGSAVNETRLLLGDASLQLLNVSVGDEGLYTCRIITPVVHTETTALEVLARPSVSLPVKAAVTEGEERTIQCDVSRFYPEKMTVTWLVQTGSGIDHAAPNQLLRVCTEPAVRNPDGTFSIRSSITVPWSAVGDEETRLVCQVEHQTFQHPLRRVVTVKLQAPSQPRYSAATLVAVTSIISLLLVSSVIGGGRYVCRAPPSVSEISQPSIVYAQIPAHLECSVHGASQRGTKVTWFRLGSGPDSGVGPEATDSLLVSEDLSEQATLQSDGNRHTSVLPVCLTVTEDLSRFRCVVQSRGRSFSRDTTVKVKVEPSFLQISSIPQIPEVERLLVLCCRVENFYPQDVHLEWSRNDGEPVAMVTHFGPFLDRGSRLFSVWSKIQLVMAREDEKAVYSCRVYHSSFPTPGYRDVCYHINTQGTPPTVMFIECDPPRPLLNQELTLHLSIRDFCPEDVSVTWTRDGQNLLQGVFNTPPSLNVGGLYSMFSFLKFTPDKDDRSSGFSCRVAHGAQKEPEERVFILPDT